MNIDDVYSSKNYYSSIKRNLKESYQIDMNYFESFHISKLKLLKEAAKRVIDQTNHVLFENNKIQSPLVPLNEALRVYLKEIYPQKRVKFKEHVNHDQQTINKSPQYILESILVKRLMDENTIPEDYIKYNQSSSKPLNNNNIYVSVLNLNENGDLDCETENPDKEDEMTKIDKLAKLTENVILQEAELQRAEIVLATKDIVSRLQKQIEDIAGMATDDILPLVDGMKENFGSPTANSFAEKAEKSLQAASDSVQNLRDLFDSYARALEKHISDGEVPNDMSLGDDVVEEPALEPEDLPEPEGYEKKSPEDALVGEGMYPELKKLTESQQASVRFAQQYNNSPMPLYLLNSTEKRQLKEAAKILKGLKNEA